MNYLTDRIRPMYAKMLTAAFGSALVSSIYSVVDMAVVGQYQGASGTATLAVIAPIWNIIYSLGLLMGIGGSVLFATTRGRLGKNNRTPDEFFSASLIGVSILALASWLLIVFFQEPLLMAFGADQSLIPYANAYLYPIRFGIPCFLFVQFLSAYLRNDGNPVLATKAVLAGGVFNVIGDIFFVFRLDMGIQGAGLATMLGSVVSLLVMLTHFTSRKNTLRFVWPRHFIRRIAQIAATGFSTFIIDIAMGVLTILFNNQIMKYLGQNALSVYGILINLSTFAQCSAYSIGQAAQPIISMNFGAGKTSRIKETLKYTLFTCALFGIIWTALMIAFPNGFVRIFMKPSQPILKIAPGIISTYGLSFLLLPLNIFSTYYFQALMEAKMSMIISCLRGIVLSGLLIMALPLINPNAIWLAMPITELLTAFLVVFEMRKSRQELGVPVQAA